MTDLNHVVVIGRTTKEIDERAFSYVGNNQARLTLSIAVNRSRKVNDEWTDEVSYFDVTVWGAQAERLKEKLHKGSKVAVDGYLKQDRWEKDGQKQSKVGIVANVCQCLDKNESAGPSNEVADDDVMF